MDNNLDQILLYMGDWGSFQKRYFIFLCGVVIFSVFPMSYIFTARDVKYRCLISECENSTSSYNTPWLKEAVPFRDGIPTRCLRYISVRNETCGSFNQNETQICQHFIYERPEKTIVNDFDIKCDENLWKLTSVGTINVLGELLCLPFSGFISDRFGRKAMMIVSVLLSTIVGTIRSFSVNYVMFIVLEFFDTALGSGMYSGAFILAMELVSPKSRNLGNTIICCAFAFGQAILGLAAWSSPDWRTFLRIIYLPGVFFISLWWLVPESVRWLLHRKRKSEVQRILTQIGKANHKPVDDQMFSKLFSSENIAHAEAQKESVMNTLKSPRLVFRTIRCSFIWISCTFVYYGLTIQSVSFADHVYLSYIFAVLVEIPSYVICHFIMRKVGRKKILCSALILGGISCICVNVLGVDIYAVKITFFLIGKLCLTIAYAVLYVYTTELFPTSSRHSMFAFCSMFGRIGSMTAPQVPLLTRISASLPMTLFGSMAGAAGVIALFFPETLNVKLPDTVDEALNIARPKESETLNYSFEVNSSG